jgi:hypothetical protein
MFRQRTWGRGKTATYVYILSNCSSYYAQKAYTEIIYFIENDAAPVVFDMLLTFLIYPKSDHNYTSYQDNTPKGERK